MSSCSDWRNPAQKHTQGHERKNVEQGGQDSKTKKHQNLESSDVFGNSEIKFDKKNVPFDKLTNPTDKVINKGSTKVDTYAKKQNNLTSQILDSGADYESFKPMTKKKPDAADNAKDDLRKTDHTYSDLFG